MSNNSKKYFAIDEAKDAVSYLERKGDRWFSIGTNNGYIELIKRSWETYHGFVSDTPHRIGYEGEQGELLKINNNHFWNIAENMIVIVTANRPKFTARAINTDKKSMVQAELANGILDYYMRIKALERRIKSAVKYAIVTGSGYIKMEWNSTRGDIYDYIEPDASSVASFDEEGNALDASGNKLEPIPVYQGDIEFKTLSFFDVIFDSTKDSPEDHDWVVTRTFVNKYDLAEKYPHLRDKILEKDTKEMLKNGLFSFVNFDETTDVPVYEFFHNRTESCPEGRHITYLDSETIMSDTMLEYERIPVYRIAPGEILGTSFGFSPMFNLIQLQEYLDMLYSTILTNQYTFGVQNVAVPIGSNVKYTNISGGLNFVEYNPEAGKPEPLNLTASPAELFNTIDRIKKDMELISGISATVRGNPESQIRSGTSMALMASQSLQFLSGLQHSYIQLLEDVGTGIISLIKRFASAPRIMSIVGERNSTKIVEFKSEDLSEIDRVVVDVGNALMTSVAGKVEIAQNLLQYGAIKSLDKFVQVIQTGNLDALLENEMDKLALIRGENENLIKGDIPVRALYFDDHVLHIQEHQAVLADSVRRMDNELVARVTTHIQEHIDLLKSLDPFVAGIVGQPAAPPEMPPAPPVPDQTNLTEAMANPEGVTSAAQEVVNVEPKLPSPPAPMEGAPVTAQQAFARNAGV